MGQITYQLFIKLNIFLECMYLLFVPEILTVLFDKFSFYYFLCNVGFFAEPRIGKFQNWAKIKVNYPTDKENTQMDFSDNFHNIQNFVQVDHL